MMLLEKKTVPVCNLTKNNNNNQNAVTLFLLQSGLIYIHCYSHLGTNYNIIFKMYPII